MKFAFLIILTSAWSGQQQTVYPFAEMTSCQEALALMKLAANSNNAVAAYCVPRAPSWWFDFGSGQEFLKSNPEYRR